MSKTLVVKRFYGKTQQNTNDSPDVKIILYIQMHEIRNKLKEKVSKLVWKYQFNVAV